MVSLPKTSATLTLAVLLAGLPGCSVAKSPAAQPAPAQPAPTAAGPVAAAAQTPEAFLQHFGLAVEGAPARFPVQVPADWSVPLGAYPEGLYWGLANAFSRDAGLDLTALRGKTVEAWRYSLAGGLPGEGDASGFHYPSDVVLLVQEHAVVGAWLTFNKGNIGPSVTQRNLQDITGLAFDQWAAQQGYFATAGLNADLANLGPAEVLAAFFTAINQGDKTRAEACLAPSTQRDALTMNNVGENRLYNPGFGPNNSWVANIVRAKLISYTMADASQPAVDIKSVGNATRVKITAQLELTWRNAAFNTPSGRTARFAGLQKYANGWKLEGLGTG